MAWYDAGTVKVTANSATVTGTGTKWLAGARQGEAFVAPDGRLYEVLNIASDTSLTLTKPYIGATATGQKYSLAPMQGYVKELADRVAALLLLSQEEWASVLKAADLQASPNDATAGKVMTVGRSFGLGSSSALGSYDLWPSASLNDANVPSGVYYTNSTIADRPNNAGGIIWHRQAGTLVSQIYEFGGVGGLLHRNSLTGTWKPLLNVGDFGLGSGTTVPNNGRTSVNPFGWYYQTTTPTWGGGSFFLDMPYGSESMNAGLRLSTDPYTDNFYFNGGVSGKKEYRPACKVAHDKNIVGDVTGGSVMESGSNTNGRWVKFADGTQICYGNKGFRDAPWEGYGWVFPLAFISQPIVTASGMGDNGGFASAPVLEVHTGSVTFRKVTNSPENERWANFGVIAIGRWKA